MSTYLLIFEHCELLSPQWYAKKWMITLILKALLNPLAKKPPKGPMTDAKIDMKMACNKNG